MNMSGAMGRLKAAAVLILNLTFSVNATIVEVGTLNDVAQYLNGSDPQATVCGFDIDFTLTCPENSATYPVNLAQYGRVLMKMIAEHKVSLQDAICATALTPQGLMEPETANVVNLSNNLATVVGLTARYSGQFAGIDFEEHTLAMLQEFGLKFSGDVGGRTVFETLPQYRGNKPVFHNGVIFCNGDKGAPVTKPQVLAEYIKAYALNVKRVVVVDDTRKHLEDCQTFFAENMPGIEFQGVHYVKAVRDFTEKCSEEEFIAYLQGVINIVNSGFIKN